MADSLIVRIDISAHDFLNYYKGHAQRVFAHAEDGRTVNFPADTLQQFVTASGIRGRFKLSFSDHGKLIKIEKV